MSFRAAGPDDVHAVAGLHAESWQRHYRGAYSDAFLDALNVFMFFLRIFGSRD